MDLNWSRGYYDGHIPGAWYAIRARLDADLGKLPDAAALVFTSPDGVLAEVAAADRSVSDGSVMALEGGTALGSRRDYRWRPGRQTWQVRPRTSA